MKYALRFMAIAIGFAFLTGCASATKRQNEVIKVGIYKVNDSLSKGRVDLAKKYSNELVKVIPKPKNFVPVKPVVVKYPDSPTPQQVVVLPPEFKETKVVVEDTPEFKKVVEENKEIKKQLETEKKELTKYQTKVDDTVKKVWEEAVKSESKGSFWAWVWGLGFTGIILLVIGVFLFPELLPFVLGWFKSLVSGFLKLFKKKDSP
jgi:hypothetical protein